MLDAQPRHFRGHKGLPTTSTSLERSSAYAHTVGNHVARGREAAHKARSGSQRRIVMADRVKGKVALITWGGSGIGGATAMLFASEGARVVIADYSVEGGERTLRAIKEAGGDAIFHAANVANPNEVEAL